MPIRNGEYVTRDVAAVVDSLADELLAREPTANPRTPSTYTNALFVALARTIVQNQEQSLQNIYEAAYIEDAEDEDLTKKARNLGVLREDAVAATGIVTFQRDSAASQDYTIPSGTPVETLGDDPVRFETTESVTIASGTTSVQANIVGVEGGVDTNVGADAIRVLPEPPSGVDSVTNPEPTGDPTVTDTDGNPLREGRDRESDRQLRARVLDTDATDEGPSLNGIQLAVGRVEGVIDTTLNTNQTASTSDGLDPYHSEVVAYGGNTDRIAQTIYETASATNVLRLQGGVNGTKETADITSELLDQTITVPITRPTVEQLTMTIDVIHTTEYAGTAPAKDAAVSVIGGTFDDDSTTTGTAIGEDVLLNAVENAVEDVRGVEFADVTFVDGDGDGTDDSTTDADGVPVYSPADSAVVRVDADAITVNETSR